MILTRRAVMVALAVGAVVTPLSAGAQPVGRAAKIACLGTVGPTWRWPNLRLGLRELGYVEGRSIVLDCRDGKVEELDALAAELVRLKPDVIVTAGTAPALAAMRATR